MRQEEHLTDTHGLNSLSNYLNEFKKELVKLKWYLGKTNIEEQKITPQNEKHLQKTLV